MVRYLPILFSKKLKADNTLYWPVIALNNIMLGICLRFSELVFYLLH
jgi:hypothetical protein